MSERVRDPGSCQRPECETPTDRVRQYLNTIACWQHQPRMMRDGTPHPEAPPTGIVRPAARAEARGERVRYRSATRAAGSSGDV